MRYTFGMVKNKQHTEKTKSTEVKKKSVKKRPQLSSARAVGMLLAGYVVLLMLLQLLTFERFPGLMEGIGLVGAWGIVVAIALVVAELLAMPFWLRLKTAVWVRRMSFVAGFVALLGLVVLELFALSSNQTVVFGATLDLPAGSWTLLFLAALWVLQVWNVWGDAKETFAFLRHVKSSK